MKYMDVFHQMTEKFDLMLKEALSAYRYLDLLFLHWKRSGVVQTKFGVFSNGIEVKGPVVGIRLAPSNQKPQNYILITRAENLTDPVELKICDDQDNTLVIRSTQKIPLISNEIVKQFPKKHLYRFWKGLFDYFPTALPGLDVGSLYPLYSTLIGSITSLWVLPDHLVYTRLPVSSASDPAVTELRLVSKTKIRNIGLLHSFRDKNFTHVLFPIDDVLTLDQSILIFVFDNKVPVPFKISAVNIVPKGVNAWHSAVTYKEPSRHETHESPSAKAIRNRHEQILENARKPLRSHNFFSEPSIPKFTIIIPLFRLDIDLLKTQCSALALDSDIGQAEIMLVMCQPEREDYLVSVIRRLIQIYGLRLSLIVLADNVDWHIAVNAGLSVLKSEDPTVFFLHPAVIPQEPGWTSRLRNALQSEANVSIAAPLLLFEDGAIAHAGYAFESTGTGWTRTEPGQGLSQDHPSAPEPGSVAAISLACAAVNLHDIEAWGGFDERFTTGDFASSELCFRVIRNGGKVIMLSDVQMWLFEKSVGSDSSKAAYLAYDNSIHPAPPCAS